MPPLLAAPGLSSSQIVLLGFAAVVGLAVALWYSGALGFLFTVVTRAFNAFVRGGFAVWRRLFAWMPWQTLLGIIVEHFNTLDLKKRFEL